MALTARMMLTAFEFLLPAISRTKLWSTLTLSKVKSLR